MPTLGTLAAGIQSVSSTRLSEIYITELGDDDLPLSDDGIPQWLRFQYFPDSIADTKAVNYQPKEVPGGSLPIYQWTNSGERTISFTAYFATDVDQLHHAERGAAVLDYDPRVSGTLGDQMLTATIAVRTSTVTVAVEAARAKLQAAGVEHRNPFILGALVWLRRFMLPRYGENSEIGVPITKPPRKMMLHVTGSGIERLGGMGGFSAPGGGILCVMTQCDVNIESMFPSGNIRIASVNLAFAEVPQRGGVVKFPSVTSDLDAVAQSWYHLSASSWNTIGLQ